jgi:hypothetical protein
MEAVVLANSATRMRLAVAGSKDSVELRLCGTEWMDESNQPVQFGFLLSENYGGTEAPVVARAVAGRAC